MGFMKYMFNYMIYFIIAAAGAYGFIKSEEFLYFEKVEAEIIKIERQCRFMREKPSLDITRYESCEKSRNNEITMQMKNYKLIEHHKVYALFISPVDKEEQKGAIYYSLNSDKLPNVGEKRTYLASKKYKWQLEHIS